MTIKLNHGRVKLEKLRWSGWYLHSIHVDEKHRNKGIGTMLMGKVMERCDAPIYLNASPDAGGDAERLYKFYKQFGFKHRKGDDIGHNYNMIYGD